MPIQNDADLVKNSGQVGMNRLYDGRSLGSFKFEVADNFQIARRPDGLPIPACATDKGECADCEYSRFANNRFATNMEIVSPIDLTDCRPLQL